MDTLRVFHDFQGCFQSVSRKFLENFQGVSKKVSCYMAPIAASHADYFKKILWCTSTKTMRLKFSGCHVGVERVFGVSEGGLDNLNTNAHVEGWLLPCLFFKPALLAKFFTRFPIFLQIGASPCTKGWFLAHFLPILPEF